MGNLWPLRDYVPVAEAARAIIELVAKVTAPLTVCNIATGRPHSVQEIIDRIEVLLDTQITVVRDEARVRAVDRKKMSADVSRLIGLLGWAPVDDFDGLLSELLVAEGLLPAAGS